MKKIIKELKALGANVEEVEGGLKLNGNWSEAYNDYHEYFVEISGGLTIVSKKHDKDFLRNLKTVGSVNTSNTVQDKDFLRNLKTVGYLWTEYTVQHKDFLRGLKTLRDLCTNYAEQDKDFLLNLKTVGSINTSHTAQHKDFLRNVEILEGLCIDYAAQDKDFLRNLKTVGYLWAEDTVQHKDFLRNLKTVGSVDTNYTAQHKDFLRNLKTVGSVNTSNTVQHKDFLRNVEILGHLWTGVTVQHKDFLRNVKSAGGIHSLLTTQHKDLLSNATNDFEYPYIYVDGILSVINSQKNVNGYTVYNTNRVGRNNTEYVATNGKYYAHASSIKEAIEDLKYKIAIRDTSWLEGKTTEDVLSSEDAILAYRAITGACSGGIRYFLNTIETKDEYSIKEIIDITVGQYGHEKFKQYFN